MRTASRLEGIGFSPIRAMHAGAPEGAIPLGLGEPTWELPEAGRRALAETAAVCSYGPNAGLPRLRAAIAAFHGAAEEELLVGAGSQGALFALFQAWLGPGDEVLVPDPGFLAYPILARLAGAAAVPYALAPDGSLDPEAFRAALEARPAAKLAVINHPANPTGAGATREALAAVAAACRARGLILVSDEVYRELHVGPRPPSLREVAADGVILGSASKAWGAPGLRVGWAIGSPELLGPARLVHNYMVTSAARPSQEAAAALIEASAEVLPAARAAIAARWAALEDGLVTELGMRPPVPAGAFYHWLPLPARAHADPLAFCLRVRDSGGVILVPGLAFGERGRRHARLSYAAAPEVVREGIRRLAPFWREA